MDMGNSPPVLYQWLVTYHTAGITNADSLAVAENAENRNPTNMAQTEIPPLRHPPDGNSNALFTTVTNAALSPHTVLPCSRGTVTSCSICMLAARRVV